MRVLVTTVPAAGHLFPMVSLAWSLRGAGHQVLVAGPRGIAKEARVAGLAATIVGGDAEFLELWPADRPMAANRVMTAEPFVAIAERTVDDVLNLVRDWRPNLLVCDPVEFSGPLAATLCGVPWVRHHWGLRISDGQFGEIFDRSRPRLDALCRGQGAPPDALDHPARIIDTCPPSLVPDGFHPETLMRYVPYNGTGLAPSWLFEPRTRPRVAASMGSVPTEVGVAGLRTIVAALGDLDVEVVLTGKGSRSAALDPLPANTRSAGWLPHDQLLPACDLVIHHGGAGSAMTALSHGLPQVVMPQMFDQFHNADQLVSCGVAAEVEFEDRRPDTVRRLVEQLLGDCPQRKMALEVQAEIAAMPAPTRVAEDLATLVDADAS